MKIFLFLVSVFILSLNIISEDINLNGWQLVQDSSAITYTFGDLLIPEGNYLIICRGNKTQQEFESFWGVTLGANVIFLDSVSPVIPQNNGRETYSLYDSFKVLQDTTMPRSFNSDKCMQRDSSNVFTFTVLPSSSASPGVFYGGGFKEGMVITEFTDTAETGNYLYNFIELYNDTVVAVGISESKEVQFNKYKIFAYLNNKDIFFHTDAPVSGVAEISIYDLSGREVVSDKMIFKNSEAVLNNVSLKSGIYFIDCRILKHNFKAKLISI
ncbi:MAG: T9SS type A sorting domain-containing protein [bacterium]